MRNWAFSILGSVVLCSVIGYLLVGCTGAIEIPEHSSLEGRNYQKFPEVSAQAVASGTAQDEFESFIADHVPNRSTVMLANATLQRSFIEAANVPFGFTGYSTFYGSEYTYVPEWRAVVEKPLAKSSMSQKKMKKAAKVYANLIESHEGPNWVFCMPDRLSVTTASPLYPLVSDSATYDYMKEGILGELPSQCTVLDSSYADTAEFFDTHFLTDHHWQIDGAIQAYDAIMKAFGKGPKDFGESYVAFEGPFWGANARSGLCTLGGGDVVRDVTFKNSDLKVYLGDEEKDGTFLDESLGNDPESFELADTFSAAYAQWFHSAQDELITVVNDSVESGSLLIIGDSYSNCMERLFAESYHTVWHIDPRDGTVDVNKFLDEHDIDDALIMLNQTWITSKSVLKNLK